MLYQISSVKWSFCPGEDELSQLTPRKWTMPSQQCLHKYYESILTNNDVNETPNGVSGYNSYHIEESTNGQPIPDSKVYGANVGPTWGGQDPGGPHVGATWVICYTNFWLYFSNSSPLVTMWQLRRYLPSTVLSRWRKRRSVSDQFSTIVAASRARGIGLVCTGVRKVRGNVSEYGYSRVKP